MTKSDWRDHFHDLGTGHGDSFKISGIFAGDELDHVHASPIGPTSPAVRIDGSAHYHRTFYGPTGPSILRDGVKND